MAGKFNALQQWLGIPPQEQPPNYYRVFGLKLFESNPEVIEAAASRVIKLIQGHADGPHDEQAKKLLPGLLAIRKCLLDPATRAVYDAKLRTSNPAAGTSPPQAVARSAPAAPPQPSAGKAGSAGVARAKPIASPPPPPPPAPVPPPAPFTPPSAAHEISAAAEASDFAALADLEPAPYSRKHSANKGSKRDRQAAKDKPTKDVGRKQGNGKHQPDEEDAEEIPDRRRKKGRGKTLVLIGFVAIGALAALVTVGFALYGPGKSSTAKAKIVAQASEKTQPEEADSPPDAATDTHAAPAASVASDAASDDKQLASADRRDAKAGSGMALKGTSADLAEDAGAAAEAAAAEPLLQLARDGGPVKTVHEMLAGGAKVDTADLGGRSLLRLAVMGGHIDLVDELIENKAQVDSVDLLGQTPLMSAAQKGDVRLVTRLLDAGGAARSPFTHHAGGRQRRTDGSAGCRTARSS